MIRGLVVVEGNESLHLSCPLQFTISSSSSSSSSPFSASCSFSTNTSFQVCLCMFVIKVIKVKQNKQRANKDGHRPWEGDEKKQKKWQNETRWCFEINYKKKWHMYVAFVTMPSGFLAVAWLGLLWSVAYWISLYNNYTLLSISKIIIKYLIHHS